MVTPIDQHRVLELLDHWHSTLDAHREEFVKEAEKVMEWDEEILKNQQAITRLTQEVANLKLSQRRLDDGLEGVTQRHGDVDRMLRDLEDYMDKLDLEEMNVADDLRRELCSLAIRVNDQLTHSRDELESLVTRLNQVYKDKEGDPLEWIRQAMHENEKTMLRIERDARTVAADASRLGEGMHDVQRLHSS